MAEMKSGRLVSLDAFRGLIMLTLAGNGFGMLDLAKDKLKSDPASGFWQFVKVQTDHPEWISNFNRVGVSYWDLIQPSFMFMVGVAMPFSYAKRLNQDGTFWSMARHALARSIILILLGVFLSSASAKQTDWTFVNVLTQIGLGYFFVFLLLGRPAPLQFLAGVAVLVGYWFWFVKFDVPGAQSYADYFAKNVNAASNFDKRFLNWFSRPEPFKANSGGYATLNFVPSMVTMLLGVMSGQLLQSKRGPWTKVFVLAGAGAVCMVLGLVAGHYVCPIVKRIWTPSWVLFSGAYVLWILAAFYMIVDAIGLKFWTYPLVVLGANSILLYVMGQLLRGWTKSQLLIHFGNLQCHRTILGYQIDWSYREFMTVGPYSHVWSACSVMLIFWLICLWLYRQKTFVRI
jgi:heparan-alpha-glucosaminide N-acetyltransferase